ncbi:MAG: glycosyltransferase family 2 protein [Thalassovita sp.]|nr:glycosyltransferase family 2 protein [Thalassovita sp.]
MKHHSPVAYTARLADPAAILVAVPVLNEAAHIARTLQDLITGAPQMRKVKIMVADGGSSDATRDIVRAFAKRHANIHLIDNPDRLQSAAVNRVVADCAEPRHQILVRVDAHCRYPPGYVLAVADSLSERGVAALATVMDSTGESCFERGAAWAADTWLGSGGSRHRGGKRSGFVDHGHHAGFRLDSWRRVGGYDTRFVANEDAELDHRIALTGGRIWLDAGIRPGYVMRSSVGGLARQYWRYGRGRAQTIRKHRMRPRLRQLVPPVIVVVNTVCLLLSFVSPVVLIVPGTYLAMLLAASFGLLMKHRRFCALWAGPALLVMHQSWGAGFLTQLAFGRGRGR